MLTFLNKSITYHSQITPVIANFSWQSCCHSEVHIIFCSTFFQRWTGSEKLIIRNYHSPFIFSARLHDEKWTFGARSIGKTSLQSKFGLIYRCTEVHLFLCNIGFDFWPSQNNIFCHFQHHIPHNNLETISVSMKHASVFISSHILYLIGFLCYRI